MRKIGLTLLFLLFLLSVCLGNAKNSYGYTQKYSCHWEIGFGCVVPNDNTYDCGPGMQADRSKCEGITQDTTCNGTVNLDCIPVTGVNKWGCNLGNCVPMASGSYTEHTCGGACNVAPTEKYKCDNFACVKDSSGTMNYIQCESTCKSPPTPSTNADCNSDSGTDTAIGCIPKDLKPFLGFLLRWALGISGGLILVMLIATGYALLTSQGNPEKLQAAKESLVSLFSGLILIVFSLVLLQTIGANVLILPTF